ncbi:hypothetical protein OBBRIDRAFT_789383 [Obba rivulosa]|uniref:holo-[acyl-carrier-protein] synthase n=1 Tax=Obba rivulosa TaxID=1052685 RepID=A0A8E2DR48_9APHY|nr:hypothetical protein OBBRIDRAFT_789383 [Obba rivulosa]
MQVWAVTIDERTITELDNAYVRGLELVDPSSRQRLQRFFRREDRFRGLAGRLLPRMLLKERGIPLSRMTFGTTEAGKPYITTPGVEPPIGYNVTHDRGLIAMAYASGPDLYPDPPAYRIGVDVMQIQLPDRHVFAEFVETVGEQLTDLERNLLIPPPGSPTLPQGEALRRFYLIWTLKEAYTKALGLGLGFDFRRIEYDVTRDVVRIDDQTPRGWEFVRFQIANSGQPGADETYVGVVARFVGEQAEAKHECTVESRSAGPWLKVWDAVKFVEMAVRELR